MNKEFKVLVIGDLIGQPALRALLALLPGLKKRFSPDAIVVNAENAADGFGLSPDQVRQILAMGVTVITSGNHIWHDRDIFPVLEQEARLLRPANYPPGTPGRGHGVYEAAGHKFAVINLQGRVRMWPIDCPFRKARELVRKIRPETPMILVDMHADSPLEKESLAWHLEGEVSAVVGTHTHVQTADERVSPGGTAYISDLGASSPDHSVIGFDAAISIDRVLTMVPLKNEVGRDCAWLRGVCIRMDPDSGKALGIERFAELSKV